MLSETNTTDAEHELDVNPKPAAEDIVGNEFVDEDDDFPFRFGFPPRPGPPPASARGLLGPGGRQSSAPASLLKHNTWSPDSLREETWQRRKDLHRRRRKDGSRMCRSVTEEDLEELRGCIDLGFGFEEDEEEVVEELDGGDRGGAGTPNSTNSGGSNNKKLWELLPALDLYYAVKRSSRQIPPPSPSSSSVVAASASTGVLSSSLSSSSAGSSPLSLYSPGDSPREVKARLKQWAQVVACSVRQQRY